jgi:stringent starvation protein B
MRYEEIDKVPLNKTAKVLYEILENGDNTVNLDTVPGGYRQYLHIRVNNVVKVWSNETGTPTLSRTNNYYDLKRCTADNFKTDFEK